MAQTSGVAATKSTATPIHSRSQGVSIASKSIPSRVIRNFPLVYFTGVLLLGTVKGWKTETPPVVSRAGFSLCASSVLSSGRLGPHNLAWEIFLLRQIAEELAIGRPLRAGFFRHIH